ncbi:hypothetical protein F4604DRAFT_1688816 [Suillus subluteus]|nr:hypothetical protein F4604DRAFT_1688816 [Suillus subluteus]
MATCEPSFEGQLPLHAAALLLLFAASRKQGRLQPGVAAWRGTVALLVVVIVVVRVTGITGLVFHWTAKYPSQDWDTAALIQAACSHCVKLAPGNRDIMMVTSISPFTRASLHFHHASKAFLPDVKIEIPRTAGKKELRISNLGPYETSCIAPLSTPPQRPYGPSNTRFGPSPPPSSPLSSRVTAMSTVSETDPEDSFPSTPDSNQLGRPQADHDNQLGAPASKTNDVFLRYMDGLSPTSCRYVVHYKEAVRERQRMRLFTTYWELEETNRLRALLTSLYAEADLEFRRAELESQVLLQALVMKQSLSRSAADVEYLTATHQCNKTSLQETDAQLDLLKDHLQQRQLTRKLDDTSNCAADSQIITDDYEFQPSGDTKLRVLVRIASRVTFAGIGQLLVGKIYPNHGNDLPENASIDPTVTLLRQPFLSQHAQGRQYAAAVQPHASGSAPQLSHLLPPANVPIYRDLHDADSQHHYDPSTNLYLQGMSAMPTPSPWHIPSYPQVHIPPPLYQHNQLLPVNRQFYENFSSSFAGNLELGDDMPPLPPFPPLPLNHGLALNIPYPSSDPMHDPVNLEAPLFMCPLDMNNPVSQMPDNIMNTSNVVSVTPHYPLTYLSAFIPEFTQPVLSKDGDALLPPGVDNEPIRESFKDIAIPEEGSTFLFYGGPNDRRGRKGKRGARYMARSHLIYDEKNRVHKHIVRFAKKEITKHALNVSSLSDEADRTALVESKLEQAAKKYMQAQGAEWVSHNSGTLKHACNLIMDGFDLCLSIWSNASEGQHQEAIIARLLNDQVFPPRFVMGLGADGKWYFLENPVILNIMLDTIQELKLDRSLCIGEGQRQNILRCRIFGRSFQNLVYETNELH